MPIKSTITASLPLGVWKVVYTKQPIMNLRTFHYANKNTSKLEAIQYLIPNEILIQWEIAIIPGLH